MTTSPEKRDNIRSLYRGGMPAKEIARRLKMAAKTVRKIVEGIPSPNGDLQPVYASLGQRRRWDSPIGHTYNHAGEFDG